MQNTENILIKPNKDKNVHKHSICSPPVAPRWHEDGVSIECGADGLEDGEAVLAAGVDDGTDGGEEPAAALGTEAVGHLAEVDTGTQRAFGGVVGVGDLAKSVGEADLPILGVPLLGAERVGNPVRGSSVSEDPLRHLLPPARLGDVEDGIGAEEDPFPPVPPLDPGRGLVGANDGAVQDPFLDGGPQIHKRGATPV